MTQYEKKWWQDSVIYQIYPRSFQDSTGTGTGDICGIISRLSYLKRLGIDAIWLSPVYQSPQDDNGYDISNYQDIDPLFGNLSDMEQLIAEAEKCGIRIIMDLVLNHTSDEHPWFQEARKGRDNTYHDYYVWREGTREVPPNDMRGCFGGSAWEWVEETGEYYFHQFSVKQPDLNWENPKVRREIYDMILWWMEKGVGGFRLDVIDQIAKEPDRKITNNGSRLHEFLRELTRETFCKGNLVTVGEAWGADTGKAKQYSNPDGSEFSMIFQFEHIGLDQQPGLEKWDIFPLKLTKLKEVLDKWQTELYGCGWNSLFWNNHDLPRIVSRWGNDSPQYREKSAKMLAAVLHGMQGTPYIYQGEELGMTNVSYRMEDYRDIETLNVYRERISQGYSEDEVMKSIHARSRDNARTPMQWDDSENAGFTTGIPWIRINPNYKEINAKVQESDSDSVYHFYRQLIALRKRYEVFVTGKFELLLPEDEHIFAYTRTCAEQRLTVIANFGEEIQTFDSEDIDEKHTRLLLSNEVNRKPGILGSYEVRMYLSCENDKE